MPIGTKAGKELKRRVIARGLVKGKSTKAIAKEAGCNRRHAARIAQEPATEFLIAEIMRPYHERLARMAKVAIDAVESAMKATHDGCLPDHDVRLRGVRRYRDLAELAQGKPTDQTETTPGLVTWEEFEVLYRKRTVHPDGHPVEPAPLG